MAQKRPIDTRHAINATCGLLQTNPRLTGNIKIVCDDNSTQLMSMSSQNGDIQRIQWSTYNTVGKNITNFLSNVASDPRYIFNFAENAHTKLAHTLMSSTWSPYTWGVKPTQDFNKWGFFAPLWLYDKMPKYFVIRGKKRKTSSLLDSTIKDVSAMPIIKIYDLHKLNIGKSILALMQEPLWQKTALHVNNNVFSTNGFDLVTGSITTKSTNMYDYASKEHSVTEWHNILSNTFNNNNQICANTFNLQFNFELAADLSMWDIVGGYSDYISLADNDDISGYTSQNLSLLNAMPSAVKFTSATNLPDQLVQWSSTDNVTLQERTELFSKWSKPSVQLLNSTKYRNVTLKIVHAIAIGDRFTIIIDDVSYHLYCDYDVNTGVYFKYSTDINVVVENLIDAILRLSNDVSGLILTTTWDATKSTLIVYADASNDIVLQLDPPDTMFSSVNDVFQYNGERTIYNFTNTVEINSAILIRDWWLNYDETPLLYAQSATLRVSDITYDVIIEKWSRVDNNIILQFTTDFELPTTLNYDLVFCLYTKIQVAIGYLAYFDVVSYDNRLLYNEPDKYNVLSTLSLIRSTFAQAANTDAVDNIDTLIASINATNTAQFVSKFNSTDTTLSYNPHDKLVEYDAEQLHSLGQLTNTTVRWGQPNAADSNNAQLVANIHTQYGHSNNRPIADSQDYHKPVSKQFDYFVMGVQPNNMTQSYGEHTVQSISDVNDLTANDAFENMFCHKLESSVNNIMAIDRIELWSVFEHTGDNCTCTFMGVTYNAPISYAGWKLTVVHVNDYDSPLARTRLINNSVNKTVIIVILKPIVVTHAIGASTLQQLIDNSIIMHRYVYYFNNDDYLAQTLCRAGLVGSVDCTISIGLPNTRQFKSSIVTTPLLNESGTRYFAVDVRNVDSSLTKLMQIGDDITVIDINNETVTFEHIVDIHAGHFWCTNIISSTIDLDALAQSIGDSLVFSQAAVIQQISALNVAVIQTTNYIGTSNKFYDMSFNSFVKSLRKIGSPIQIAQPNTIVVSQSLSAVSSNQSHMLVDNGGQAIYAIQRHRSKCTPIVNKVFSTISLVHNNITYIKAVPQIATLSEYVIHKYGDQNTLSTDGSIHAPAKRVFGEIVADYIDVNFVKHWRANNMYRTYIRRNQWLHASVNDLFGLHSSYLSSVQMFKPMSFVHSYNMTTDTYIFDGLTHAIASIKSQLGVTSVTDNAIREHLLFLLNWRTWSVNAASNNVVQTIGLSTNITDIQNIVLHLPDSVNKTVIVTVYIS